MITVGTDVYDNNTVFNLFDPAAPRHCQHRTATVPTTAQGTVSVLRRLEGPCRVAFKVGAQARWPAAIVRPVAAEFQVAKPRPDPLALS